MELESLLPALEADSPVVGVVLMVAVTVVLSAVVGTFALGLDETVRTTPPETRFDVEYDDPELVVVHGGGDALAGEHHRIVSGTTTMDWGPGRVRAGDARTLDRTDGDFVRGGTVHVVWVAEGRSTTVRSFEVPA